MLSKYSKIILDVSHTLYDNNQVPLQGAEEFLNKYKHKIIILSNVGSLTGEELKKKLNSKFNINLENVITSLDLVINHLKTFNYSNIFHYGSFKVLEKLVRKTNLNFVDFNNPKIETVLFTSLCNSSSWIKLTQNTLNVMTRPGIKIILGNPDRSCPIKPHNFTVSLIHDALMSSCSELGYKPDGIEIGKPYIGRLDLGISIKDKIVVIGDNPKTDGLLALKNKFDYIQVGNKIVDEKIKINLKVKNINNLDELI